MAQTNPFSERVYETIHSWPEVKITPAVCIGSWAYADFAVELSSLARHMRTSNFNWQGTERTGSDIEYGSEVRMLNQSDRSPPCYVCSDATRVAKDDSISTDTHLLVILLLEDYDFFVPLPQLQRLGSHRTRQTLVAPPTLARIRALRLWGWPVICIRERDWLAAEIEDTVQYNRSSADSNTSVSRRQLFFSSLARLASRDQ